MQNSYINKVVLVTGGTSGIGKTTAIAFAEAGAKVVITGRREKEGTAVAAEITKRVFEKSFTCTDYRRVMRIKNDVDKLYDTDLTDAAWSLIAPILPAARAVSAFLCVGRFLFNVLLAEVLLV